VSTITGTPRLFWLAHAATSVVAVGLQLAGVYAAVVTFGLLLTVAISLIESWLPRALAPLTLSSEGLQVC